MQVNKKAYAETLSQFNLTGISSMFDELNDKIVITCEDTDAENRLIDHMGYDAIGEFTKELNETYRALCQPRYNIVISLDTIDEVNAYLSKIGTKGVRVLKDEVEIDVPQHADSCED